MSVRSPVMRAIAVAIAALGLAMGSPARAADRYDDAIAAAKAQMMADPAAARRSAALAQQLAGQGTGARRAQRLATAEWLQAEAGLRTGDAQGAEVLIERALKRIADAPVRTKLLGDLLMARGGAQAETAHVAAALASYQAAYNIFRDIGETRSQSLALVTIGMLYQGADDNENALKYYSRALDVRGADPVLAASVMLNRGTSLKDLKRYDEAAQQFDRTLALAKRLGLDALQAKVHRNLARLAIDRQDYARADLAIAQGLAAARRAGQLAQSQPQFDAIGAEIALRRGQLDRARRLIESGFSGADLAATDLGYREAHYTGYEIYAALGDTPRALAHLRAMKRLDDQVWKLTASSNTALMAARFDSANQEARISKLKAEESARKLAMERAQVRFQRILFGSIGVAALVVLGLLGVGLYQSRRARVRLSASNTALEKALAAKTEFLATTSHEIRTPLNGILGMTQVMLADPRLDPTLKDRVGIVQEAGFTMRSLVDDILDVAKMETGNLTVEALPFDLKAMLEDVTRMWAEQARAKGLEFRLELGDCPRGLIGDAGRVRQVVYNLLSNAVKFTATGSVTVRAQCAGDRMRITVADTGIGIAADKHAEIFESFKQADGGTTRQFGGTGLGLAIVRNIVTAMEGSVTVDSAPDAGAAFTVELPFQAAELEKPAAEVAGGGLLIVDKNPIARAMLRAVLEPRAGTVTFAATCAEAAGLAGGVARILVDEATARAEGPDPVTALAALTATVSAPVAVLWPAPDDTVRHALSVAGVAQVIAKPIAGPALASALYTDNTLVSQAA